jgi:D-arginine dehydrogenase
MKGLRLAGLRERERSVASECDIVVIGGGIAGASAAFELALQHRVILLEREEFPGYHSSGRSAAFFSETYGNRAVRALTVASRKFFMGPPPGFADTPLLRRCGAVAFGRADQRAAVERVYAASRELVSSVELLDERELRRRVPALRPGYAVAAVAEPEACRIDVNALHQGYLRGLKARGGRVVCNAEVGALERGGEGWRIASRAGAFAAAVVVDAAGAWADAIAKLAGARPVGLVPKRRTAIIFDAPAGVAVDAWPVASDIDEQFYFLPETGRILGSPADETPMPPCDVQPEELDVALAADRIERATTLKVERVVRRWAGLRSFVADKTLVIGYDEAAPGFFWLAGQGGYGFQTAPAASRCAAALVQHQELPKDVSALGLAPAQLAPARCRAPALALG